MKQSATHAEKTGIRTSRPQALPRGTEASARVRCRRRPPWQGRGVTLPKERPAGQKEQTPQSAASYPPTPHFRHSPPWPRLARAPCRTWDNRQGGPAESQDASDKCGSHFEAPASSQPGASETFVGNARNKSKRPRRPAGREVQWIHPPPCHKPDRLPFQECLVILPAKARLSFSAGAWRDPQVPPRASEAKLQRLFEALFE